MKRFLFIALLLTAGLASVAPARAQQAAQVEPKLMFASRINEVDATLSRARMEDAQRVFQELAAMMQKHIAESKNAKASTLYAETKMLSADMTKNRAELVAKLREFLDLM
jgi:hypothetical protein